ncbi:HPF/RaiA family ribosome-associated protein [Azorhizophilus paspali]|uniref:HPF/RaiA family ribosome-associated protein n=1 Tax=Azorhizophilus paspali TaxID=69963 RepID=A0ABV6SK97_AZOPA
MQKPVQIHFHQIEPSPAIEAHIREQCDELEEFYERIIGCSVTFDAPHRRHHQGRLYQVKVHLTLPDGDIHSSQAHHDEHTHEDPYVAIRDSFRAVRRQLEDYARKRRAEVKSHEPAQQEGRVSELHGERDFGILETMDGRQIYFHRHSVLNAAFDHLHVGDQVRFSEEAGEQGPQASTVHPPGRSHAQG